MKDLVISISKIFNREEINFILIGALARDIYFEEKNLKLDIRTKDIDFAVLVKDWNDFHNDENEALLEQFSDDEDALWIAILGSRVQTLLGDSDLSSYLKNLMKSGPTIGSLIKDMNEGNIPGQERENLLKSLAAPLKGGLTR